MEPLKYRRSDEEVLGDQPEEMDATARVSREEQIKYTTRGD